MPFPILGLKGKKPILVPYLYCFQEDISLSAFLRPPFPVGSFFQDRSPALHGVSLASAVDPCFGEGIDSQFGLAHRLNDKIDIAALLGRRKYAALLFFSPLYGIMFYLYPF